MTLGNHSLNFSLFIKKSGKNEIDKEKLIGFIKKNDIQSVLWDLDGTLYSSKKLKRKIFFTFNFFMMSKITKTNQIIESNRHSPIKEINLSNPTWFSDYKSTQNFINQQLSPQIIQLEVFSALQLFKELKLNQILLTDHALENKLQLLALENHFHHTFSCFDDIGYWKPSTKILDFLSQKINLKLSETLVIGDRKDTDGRLSEMCRRFILVNH